MLAGCLVLLAGCSEAPTVALVPTNRVVLAEFFTFSRCVYCPYAARALDSVAQGSADSLVIIAWHRREDGDTLSPTYVESRSALYGEAGGGEPATAFDGGALIRTSGPSYNHTAFQDAYSVAKTHDPLVRLAVSATISTSVCSVAAQVVGVDSTPGETLHLFVVFCEDSVHSQLIGNAETLFNHVVRGMLPDENGTAMVLTRNDTFNFARTAELAPFWNPARLRVVAFVQDLNTLQVLQAAQCRPTIWEGE
jgi:hypothetical protein